MAQKLHHKTPHSNAPQQGTGSAATSATSAGGNHPHHNWPITSQPPLSATSSIASQSANLRHSTSGGRPYSGTTTTTSAAAGTTTSTSAGGSGLRGFFGRRSRSHQYQELPHKPVDPQAPRLPLVYLSPPASPESITTTPEKVRIGINGNNSHTHTDFKNKSLISSSSAVSRQAPPAPVPGIGSGSKTASMMTTSIRNNRHSIQSTAASMSPRMRRRRRDPTPFNILVIGFLGSGKTSFIRFLKDSLGDSKRIRNVSQLSNEEAAEQNIEDDVTQPPQKTHGFEKHYLEKEVDGERVGLTIFDSEGFGPREQNVVDIQLSLLINFITGKFEETFAEVHLLFLVA